MSEPKDGSGEGETPLGEDVDLAAWNAQSPPSDFAERVLARVAGEKVAPPRTSDVPSLALPRSRRRWWIGSSAVGAALVAASLAMTFGRAGVGGVGGPSKGEMIASERVEVSVGQRARVVLEPGAALKWNGDDVEQARGDVFYRVELGARFRVKTPAGAVEVKGTCFTVRVREMQKRDLKVGAIGAGAAALLMVGVHEGKVAVSHAGQRVELTAGEAMASEGQGAFTKRTLAEGQIAFDARAAEADEPLASANQNLVGQVSEYRRRLEAVAAQKSEIEAKLAATEKQLDAARSDGAVPKAKNEFDLEPNDWKELAKSGTIKARTPCFRDDGWTPAPDTLNRLGLAPGDAPVLKSAYARSNQRVWEAIKPVCIAALGSVEVAEKLGPRTCQHLVLDMERAKDSKATDDAMVLVGEVRGGLKPAPAPGELLHPVAKMFLALTAEPSTFESELAQSFGPQEAHRLVFDEDMCMSHSTWGSGVNRRPR